MNRSLLLPLLLVALFTGNPTAKDFQTRVVDGLGRGVAEVEFNVHWIQSGTNNETARAVEVFRGATDSQGRIHVRYEDALVPASAYVFAELEKPGYAGYSDSELKAEYVLAVEATQSFADVAALDAGLRVEALRELLAADDLEEDDAAESFAHEDALRAPLRALVGDPKVGRAAIEILSSIGVRSDLEYILLNRPKIVSEEDEGYEFWENRCAYGVATALVDPDSEAAWEFLEACASGDFDDRWVDAGAVFTLLLSDSDRASAVLARAAKRNADRREWIEKKLALDSAPASSGLINPNLEAAAQALGSALEIGQFKGIAEPVFNLVKDKSHIALTYRSGRDLLVYTATYHRSADGLWHLRGVRETMQALMASDDD